MQSGEVEIHAELRTGNDDDDMQTWEQEVRMTICRPENRK
jgi:hypothetical protein